MRRLWTLLLYLLLLPRTEAAALPSPMLASQWRDGPDVSRYWVSEKLDGVRARWDGHALWTRAGHRIDAPDGFTRGWPPQPWTASCGQGAAASNTPAAACAAIRPTRMTGEACG